jgi:hypothetical protein
LTKKKIAKPCSLLKVTKEISIFLLYIFIIVLYYYICIYTYNIFNNYSYEVTTACTTNLEELKPTNLPNIWYKSIIDDFLNQFTSNGKTINHDFFKLRSYVKISPLDYNQDTIEKSIILNRIKSEHMNSLIAECEFYKNKTSLLEIELQWIKVIHCSLVDDLKDILKDVIVKKS